MSKMQSRPHHDASDGVLKDGRSYEVPVQFMKSVSHSVRNQFARVHDGNGNSGAALQRPGFRVADEFVRDEAMVAYQQYEAAIQDEWRNIRPADFGSPGVGRDENTCSQDKPENYLSDLHADVDEQVKAFERQHGGTYERGPRQQGSDVTALMHDHQQRMATLYAERERELQEEWRHGK